MRPSDSEVRRGFLVTHSRAALWHTDMSLRGTRRTVPAATRQLVFHFYKNQTTEL